jgi:hypothetical protein
MLDFLCVLIVIVLIYYWWNKDSNEDTKSNNGWGSGGWFSKWWNEGLVVCTGCDNTQSLPMGNFRNPYYWPYSGSTCFRGIATIPLAHASEPDHPPMM